MDPEQARLKRRFKRRLVKMIADLDSYIADAEDLMRRRPDVPPIELEDAYLQRAEARNALAALEEGRPPTTRDFMDK